MITPWLSKTVLKNISRRINQQSVVFEWGSGGSTIYLAQRVKNVISIENNLEWYNKLIEIIPKNVELRYLPADSETGDDFLNPDAYTSCSRIYYGKIFKKYALCINEYDYLFDFIIVDGRARISCLKQASEKVRAGGTIMLHDSQRDYYVPGITLVSDTNWDVTVFHGRVTTHFFTKIK